MANVAAVLGVREQSGVVDHPVFGRVRFRVTEMPVDAQGQVETTVDMMCRKVQEDSKDPGFIKWTYEKVSGVPGAGGNSQRSLVEAVFQVVRGGIRFQRDEATGAGVGGYQQSEVTEVIVRPVDMAGFVDQGIAVGDCDDFSSLVAAMLTVLGIDCCFALVAADSRAPGEFSHVYVASYPVDGDGQCQRVPVDASHGQYCGWEVSAGRVQEVPVTGSMSGLGGWGWLGLGLIGVIGWWLVGKHG